jgi:hypothetical protein
MDVPECILGHNEANFLDRGKLKTSRKSAENSAFDGCNN